jgi:hypothetical protein
LECGKTRSNLIRHRVGGDVDVARRAAERQVAHRSTDEPGLVTGGAQRTRDRTCDAQRRARQLLDRRPVHRA